MLAPHAKLSAIAVSFACTILLGAFGSTPQSQAPPPTPPSQQTPPPANSSQQTAVPTQTDAAAAAARAERVRKAQAFAKQLEDGASPNQVQDAPLTDPNQTLFISPAKVHMLVGEVQPFNAFDIDGRDLSTAVQWSLDDAKIAYPTSGASTEITAKAPGTVKMRAKIGGRTAEADITVVPGIKLPQGSKRWEAPAIPGYHSTQIVPAVPSASGIDVYEVEENAGGGSSLIRAFNSDGRQVWMKVVTGKIDKLIPAFK
jgi:hypothetical protein